MSFLVPAAKWLLTDTTRDRGWQSPRAPTVHGTTFKGSTSFYLHLKGQLTSANVPVRISLAEGNPGTESAPPSTRSSLWPRHKCLKQPRLGEAGSLGAKWRVELEVGGLPRPGLGPFPATLPATLPLSKSLPLSEVRTPCA